VGIRNSEVSLCLTGRRTPSLILMSVDILGRDLFSKKGKGSSLSFLVSSICLEFLGAASAGVAAMKFSSLF